MLQTLDHALTIAAEFILIAGLGYFTLAYLSLALGQHPASKATAQFSNPTHPDHEDHATVTTLYHLHEQMRSRPYQLAHVQNTLDAAELPATPLPLPHFTP